MRAFLSNQKPRSVNARTTDRFQERIRQSYREYNSADILLTEPLYGVVYYFHKRNNQLDADNLSKPIWDALEGVVFGDDLLIQIRHAGIVDLRNTDMTTFDLSNMPDLVAEQFIQMIGVEDHILYVELGSLHQSMFVFGHEVQGEA
jgi:Holliday junction resolvase RusA-like endonuclease